MDSGGGHNSTMTMKVWHVLERTYYFQEINCNGSKGGGQEELVILAINYVTLNDDQYEQESLIVPSKLMSHDIRLDFTPKLYGGDGGM
eukprot:12709581-Ditylum_brightwellii.AAC.1